MGNVGYRNAECGLHEHGLHERAHERDLHERDLHERGLHERGLHEVVNAHKLEFQMLTGGLWDGEVKV